MVAYNFQKRFVEAIATGTKTQTMRVQGTRRHARPGDELQLYTGMRRKGETRLILRADCIGFERIRIYLPTPSDRGSILFFAGETKGTMIELNRFARADGFANWQELCAWIRDTHGDVATFDCCLIRWRPHPL